MSRYCVVFTSADYALDRVLRSREDYVLPVRFDDTDLPGLRASIGYLDARRSSPADVVGHLMTKLGGAPDTREVRATVLALRADGPADLDAVLDRAAADAGIAIDNRRSERGLLVATVAHGAASPGRVLERLVPAIESAWGERTGQPLLIGAHRGVVPGGDDWSCVDVSTAVDAVDAHAVRALLAVADGADCAVAVSQRLYDEVVRLDARRERYRGLPLPGGAAVWVRVPGYDKPPAPPAPAARDRGPGQVRITTVGDHARIEHLGDRHG
ncbi:hypothetical protein [Saccharothrix xinjiangensis]|uniref:hypothetical protein n=1 Tax=Saccharothrix xinjiangensis TaxID=204798 RepID=UPI0031CEE914